MVSIDAACLHFCFEGWSWLIAVQFAWRLCPLSSSFTSFQDGASNLRQRYWKARSGTGRLTKPAVIEIHIIRIYSISVWFLAVFRIVEVMCSEFWESCLVDCNSFQPFAAIFVRGAPHIIIQTLPLEYVGRLEHESKHRRYHGQGHRRFVQKLHVECVSLSATVLGLPTQHVANQRFAEAFSVF